MATYAYRCPACGDFDLTRPMGEAPDRADLHALWCVLAAAVGRAVARRDEPGPAFRDGSRGGQPGRTRGGPTLARRRAPLVVSPGRAGPRRRTGISGGRPRLPEGGRVVASVGLFYVGAVLFING